MTNWVCVGLRGLWMLSVVVCAWLFSGMLFWGDSHWQSQWHTERKIVAPIVNRSFVIRYSVFGIRYSVFSPH
jgi:hypothetical protein